MKTFTIPNRAEVESSNVRAIGYDGEARTLYVEFHSQDAEGRYRTYAYSGVPETVFRDFCDMPVEKGFFFDRFVKWSYKCEEITGAGAEIEGHG